MQILEQSLCAIALALVFSFPSIRSQSTQFSLSFDTPLTLTGNNFSTTSTTPVLLSLPSASQITVSLALCTTASSNPPRVFLSNSNSVIPGPTSGGPDVYEVTLSSLGLGNFTLELPATGDSAGGAGLLAVYGGTTSDSLEIGVSQGAVTPLHAPLADLPFFGDSTANRAILFSPPFLPPEQVPEPAFPNYTLPQANTTLPELPSSSSSPNFTLFIAPLDTGLAALPQTACAIRTRALANDTGTTPSPQILVERSWLRDPNGWRREWLVSGLQPLTNYTVYAIQDKTRLSGPIYFTTKSASFSCQLVHDLPYCPTTAFAVPLPPLPDNVPAYNASNLPDNLTSPLLGYLTNFTTSLLTTACGRDAYSPLQTCADCQAAYRQWLCAISFPRCGEFPQASPTSPAPQQGQAALAAQQPPPPALQPQPSGAPWRNVALGNATTNYIVLLPCIETCNAADRACPISLGFRCPDPQTTGPQSYGVGFIDSADGDIMNGGTPGGAQDQWGNVFCNGS